MNERVAIIKHLLDFLHAIFLLNIGNGHQNNQVTKKTIYFYQVAHCNGGTSETNATMSHLEQRD